MARIRTIKPEFFTSLTIADLTPEQRLTFIGLWTHVDDEGRCVDDARLIKAALWPLDDRTAADIEGDLRALTESSLITRYTLNRKHYIAVTSWHEHQRINRKTPSKLPAPEQGEILPPKPPASGNDDSSSTHTQLTEDSPQERKGKEGNREGKGSPPPSAGPPKGATTRGTRIPDDFAVNDDMRDWARKNAPLCGTKDHEAFCDYWGSIPGAKGRKVDWVKTWRNWMRREQEKRAEQQAPSRRSSAAKPGPDERAAQIQALKGQTTVEDALNDLPDNVHTLIRGEIA